MPGKDRPLLFFAIPKTAGTSLSQELSSALGANQHKAVNDLPQDDLGYYEVEPCLQALAPMLADDSVVRGVSGHMPVDCLAKLDDDVVAATMLREPGARMLSGLAYGLGQIEGVNTERVNLLIVLHNLLTSDGGVGYDNPLVRSLAGDPSLRRNDADGVAERAVTEADAEAAIRTLARFHFVGFTECYKDFRNRLFRHMGLAPSTSVVRANRTAIRYPSLHNLPSDTRNRLNARVRLDRYVYETAAQRFMPRLHQLTRQLSPLRALWRR